MMVMRVVVETVLRMVVRNEYICEVFPEFYLISVVWTAPLMIWSRR